MNRRRVLAATAAACTLPAGGCLGGDDPPPSPSDDGDDDGEPGSGAVPHDPEPAPAPELPAGPEEAPRRPDEVTLESVSSYASDFEYARVYNHLHCSDLDAIDVSASAALARETDHGVYAFAAASGFARCGTGPEPEHRDYGREPAEYAVGEEFVVRVGETEPVESDSAGEVGLGITNFDHHAVELEVTVDRDGEEVFADVVELAARSRVRVRAVAGARGDHDLAVETDEGATAAGTWSVDPDRSFDRTVRVLATGELEVGSLDPYDELRANRDGGRG